MAGWAKKDFSYCIRRLRQQGVTVLAAGLHVVLHKHLIDVHDECDSEWCVKKRDGGNGKLSKIDEKVVRVSCPTRTERRVT